MNKDKPILLRRSTTPSLRSCVINVHHGSQFIALLIAIILPAIVVIAHPIANDRMIAINRTLDQQPSNTKALLQRAALWIELQHIDEAHADCMQALSYEPGMVNASLLSIKCLQLQGKTIEALEDAQILRRSNPSNIHVGLAEARLTASMNDCAEAIQLMNIALGRMATPSPALFLERATWHVALATHSGSSLDLAIDSLDQAMERIGPIESLQQQALTYELQSHQIDAALYRIDTIIETRQRPAALLIRKAEILLEANRMPEAMKLCTAAIHAVDQLPRRHQQPAVFESMLASINRLLLKIFVLPNSPVRSIHLREA